MDVFRSLFFYIYLRHICLAFLNQDETQMSFDLIKELEIRHCIMIGYIEYKDLIIHVKKFSAANIPITNFRFVSSIRYIQDNDDLYFRKGLILVEEDLNILSLYSRIFEKVNQFLRRKSFDQADV